MESLFILLQAAPGAGYMNIIFFGGIILVFYFFMIRPQQKKQKDAKKFQDEIKKGSHVVTVGGIHGKVFEVLDDEVMLDVDRGSMLKVDKSALSLDATKRINEEKK